MKVKELTDSQKKALFAAADNYLSLLRQDAIDPTLRGGLPMPRNEFVDIALDESGHLYGYGDGGVHSADLITPEPGLSEWLNSLPGELPDSVYALFAEHFPEVVE